MGGDRLIRFCLHLFFLGIWLTWIHGTLLQETLRVLWHLVGWWSGAIVKLGAYFEVGLFVEFVGETNHHLGLVLILRRDISIRSGKRTGI